MALFVLMIILAYTVIWGVGGKGVEKQRQWRLTGFDPATCTLNISSDQFNNDLTVAMLVPVPYDHGESAGASRIVSQALADLNGKTFNQALEFKRGGTLEKYLVANGLADLRERFTIPAALEAIRNDARSSRKGLWSLVKE